MKVEISAYQPTATRSGAKVQTQVVSADLQRWLADHLRAGTPPPQIIDGMVKAGWDTALAWRALGDAQNAHNTALARKVKAHVAAHLPEPEVADGRNEITVDGHCIRVAMAVKHPRVVLFDGFMTPEECQALMDQASPRLARSETVDNANGGNEVNAARTSDGMFFSRGESELITRIEARIAALLRWPVSHGEGLQVLRYRPGAEYLPHFDYFDPVHPGSAAVLTRGGQRVGTLVMYLNAPQRGGSTTFPAIGLEVAPVQGSAVFFSYDRPDASTGTLHGGAPVLEGEKWVATKWLREGEFV